MPIFSESCLFILLPSPTIIDIKRIRKDTSVVEKISQHLLGEEAEKKPRNSFLSK